MTNDFDVEKFLADNQIINKAREEKKAKGGTEIYKSIGTGGSKDVPRYYVATKSAGVTGRTDAIRTSRPTPPNSIERDTLEEKISRKSWE